MTLCELHDNIITDLESVKDYIDLENNSAILLIDEIVKEIVKAKNIGQSMEDRLYLYRTAIENLGFERVKK